MRSQEWKTAGLILALSGSMALAQAENRTNAPPQMKASKLGPEMKGPKPGPEKMIERFDADGDGHLNEAERQAMDEAMLKHRDRRGGPSRPSREEIMKRFDADGDGVLSEVEREAMRTERERIREENSKRFDADGDGQLSEAERKTMHETLRAERPAPPSQANVDN